MIRSITVLCALAILTACHGGDSDDTHSGVTCTSLTIPVACTGSHPAVMDGGWMHCPAGCGITGSPCAILHNPGESCNGYECAHAVNCPCDGSPCVDSGPWDGGQFDE